MKIKSIIIIVVATFIVIYLYLKLNPIWTGEKIELKYVKSIKLSIDINDDAYFANSGWRVITGEEQRLNWKESGYDLPAINFDEAFLIVSKNRINALYKEKGCDDCSGTSDGFALYDYLSSESSTYYIYTIPKIWLSQGVG